MIRIRDATVDDTFAMAPHVRPEDGLECIRFNDQGPLDALQLGLRISLSCKTVELAGRPIAMFGVAPDTTPWPPQPATRVGIIWMLTTPDLLRYGKTLMRVAPTWLDRLASGFDVTGNYVDLLNEMHVRWLTRMGYQFTNIIQDFGPYHSPFLQFTKASHV